MRGKGTYINTPTHLPVPVLTRKQGQLSLPEICTQGFGFPIQNRASPKGKADEAGMGHTFKHLRTITPLKRFDNENDHADLDRGV